MDQRTSAIGTASFLKSWAFYRNREWIKSVVSRIIISKATMNELEDSNMGVDVEDVVRRNRIMGMVRTWEKAGYARILQERDARESETFSFGETITGITSSEISSLLATKALKIPILLSDSMEMKRIPPPGFENVRVVSSLDLLKDILAVRTGSGTEDQRRAIEINLRIFTAAVGPILDEDTMERTVNEIYEKGKKPFRGQQMEKWSRIRIREEIKMGTKGTP